MKRTRPFKALVWLENKLTTGAKQFCRNVDFTNAFESLQLNLSAMATLAVVERKPLEAGFNKRKIRGRLFVLVRWPLGVVEL